MKIKLEITASYELLEAIKLIFGGIANSAMKTEAVEPEVTAAPRRVRATASEKSAPKEEVASENEGAAEENTSEETTSNDPITVETVRAAVQAKAQSGKRDQVKSLLTKFEVARVTDLPDTKYAKFLEEVNAL